VAADPLLAALLREALEAVVLLLAPIVPHFCEELWEAFGHEDGLSYVPVPVCDADSLHDESVLVVIQINGKVRERLTVARDLDEEKLKELALASPKIQKYTADKSPRKVIVIPNKLVNVVV
jgi:leucyl-tRNA synthetase